MGRLSLLDQQCVPTAIFAARSVCIIHYCMQNVQYQLAPFAEVRQQAMSQEYANMSHFLDFHQMI